MRDKRERDNDRSEVTRFGFTWGPMKVTRFATLPKHRALGVETDHAEVQVYVSNGGRSIRVFKDGRELK